MNRIGLVAMTILVAFLTPDAHAQWTRIDGPYGGSVQCVAEKGPYLFMGTSDGQVFRKTDSDTRWTSVSDGLSGNRVDALAASTTHLFAAMYPGGVYRSSNDGESWTLSNTGVRYPGDLSSLAICGTNVFASGDGGICRSTDNGRSWTAANVGAPFGQIVACGTKLIAAALAGLLFSTNNGESWEFSGVYSGYDVRALAADSPAVIVGTNRGLLLSTNGGSTFVQAGLDTFLVYSVALMGRNLFAAVYQNQTGGPRGVFFSTNNGTTWTPVNTGLPRYDTLFIPWTFLSVSGTKLYAANASGLFVLSSSDTSWTQVSSTGMTYKASVSSIAASGTNLFAAMQDLGGGHVGIFRLKSNDTYWTACNSGWTGGWAPMLTALGGNLFAGSDGVYRSSDDGEHWTKVKDGRVAMLATNGTNLFASMGPTGGGWPYGGPVVPGGLFITKDSGTSWSRIDSGLSCLYVTSLIEMDNESLFAGSDSGVFRSTDIGATWAVCDPSFGTRRIGALAAIGTKLFAGTDGGVFLSTNNGGSWSQLNTGLTDTMVKALAVSGTNLFTSTGGGVFLLRANGTMWMPVVTDLPGGPTTLAVNSAFLFAGTREGGVWKSPIHPIPALTYVHDVALATPPYGRPGIDSLAAMAVITNPNGHSVVTSLLVMDPSNLAVDSIVMLNQGVHVGGQPGDSILSVRFRAPSVENFYSLTLRMDDKTISSRKVVPRVAFFATAGPVECIGDTSSDTPAWGRTIFFRLKVRNSWKAAEVPAVGGRMRSLDTAATVMETDPFAVGDIVPGQVRVSSTLAVSFSQWCTRDREIPMEIMFSSSSVDYWRDTLMIHVATVDVQDQMQVPIVYELSQNFPNPFNPSTTIRYGLPHKSAVQLTIYNTLGQQVAVLQNGEQDAGYHEVKFDGSNRASGVYFYRIQAGDFTQTRRFLLLK